ncbi:MAG: prolyl oligopeptidase family serine peptidase [bacterium]|nr:prolyl oligopeptidase family serine peptidase [bacterium]
MRTAALYIASILAFGCTLAGDPERQSSAPANGRSTERPTKLTLDRILSRSQLTGTSPSSPSWAPDSSRLAFRWRDVNGTRSEIWLVEADGSDLRRLNRTAGNSDTEGRAAVRQFAWLPDSSGLVYLQAGELRRTDLNGNSRPIAAIAGGPSDLQVSPDGRYASFLKAADLWLVELANGRVRRVTTVGVPAISKLPLGRYHRPDVEIGPYVWGGPTYAWSPDSRRIAVHHVDRREMRTVPFPNYLGKETEPNLVRRSYPGDPNERRTVGILAVESGELRLIDLPDQTDVRIVDFSWSARGRLLIDREADTAVDRWLHVYEPSNDRLREVFHDHRETRVYTTCGSAWHPNGHHVIVLADLADRYGLYSLGIDGVASNLPTPRLLTDPRFDVTSSPIVTADGGIHYTANAPSPYEQHVFRTTLDGGTPTRHTTRPGQARPYPAPNGRRLAVLHSADLSPTELFLVDYGADDERRITNSRPPAFTAQNWATPRYVTFPSGVDDATLHARILEPTDLDRTRRHPVIFGPVYSNTVRNRWAGFYGLFQQLLVAKGYIVVQVDVRGSTGYGREFREEFLTDFAGKDLDDLASAVAYLEKLSYVDPDRIGIWGSSYGGTLTVYSLLKKPGLFDAGVACAAAVDPYFFGGDDVAIVRRPDTHPDAFRRGAAQYAGNLQDPLLLIHGMQDQVVPFKTIVALAEDLMRQGKDFDFAFAPAATHGWTGRRHYARYLLGKLMAHFDRHLGRGADGLSEKR